MLNFRIIQSLVITIMFTILYLFNVPAFSEEQKNINLKLNFINISEQDYISYFLPLLPAQDYVYTRNYSYSDSIYNPAVNTVNFYEGKKTIEDKEFYRLSSNAVDKNGIGFTFIWDISTGYSFDNRKNEALKFTTETIFDSRENDINTVFAKKLINSELITDLNPIYSDGDEVTAVKGYEFSYSIKQSSGYYAGRTLSEIILCCSVGMANYYLTKFENMVDWKYTYTWDDAQRKVKDGWYWDPNNFNTNTLYHIYSGMTYYQIARSNYYTIPESLAWAYGASFFWEYFGEWREQVSMNDMIFTPFLGSISWEAIIQACNYIEANMKPGPVRDIIYLVINPFGWINKKLDASNSWDIRVRLVFTNPVQAAIDNRIEKEIMNR